jgi:TfoX/Sxy family transcriptional regulator of competence genes
MQIPKATPNAVKVFEGLTPPDPRVTGKKMFGQPAAFLNGHLFFGVYGEEVFVRLSETDRAEALRARGAHPFEPMPGRPMKEYVVLPPSVWADRPAARQWVARAVRHASTLPDKKSAPRRTKGR